MIFCLAFYLSCSVVLLELFPEVLRSFYACTHKLLIVYN